MCGPNHAIRNQQVPGYTGHIVGLVSENLYAKSYGNTTAQAIAKKHPIGYDLQDTKARFQSQNSSQYVAKNFRRFIDKPQMLPRKDYDDYTTFINDTFNGKKEQMLNTLSEMKIKEKESRTHSSNPYASSTNEHWLKRMSSLRNHSSAMTGLGKHQRNLSHRITTPNTEKLGVLMEYEVKPRILEISWQGVEVC